MDDSAQISIDIPISSVIMVDEPQETTSADLPQEKEGRSMRNEQELEGICRALKEAVCQLNTSCEQTFSSNREQIVRLSVQIAEKILLKEISSGNYEIEKIVAEALKTAPTQQDVVVRINPQDLQRYHQSGNDLLANVKLVADPGIGCAECVVETNKGMIEYFINEHLRQVTEALEAMK